MVHQQWRLGRRAQKMKISQEDQKSEKKTQFQETKKTRFSFYKRSVN